MSDRGRPRGCIIHVLCRGPGQQDLLWCPSCLPTRPFSNPFLRPPTISHYSCQLEGKCFNPTDGLKENLHALTSSSVGTLPSHCLAPVWKEGKGEGEEGVTLLAVGCLSRFSLLGDTMTSVPVCVDPTGVDCKATPNLTQMQTFREGDTTRARDYFEY